jgi:diadenosine tetraphosphate (Ap4A) HIT family hydrolase
MLMMVDPNVHFHVFPRYSGERTWQSIAFPDVGWPGPPKLDAAVALDEEQIRQLAAELISLNL